jgi:hypothetical protein
MFLRATLDGAKQIEVAKENRVTARRSKSHLRHSGAMRSIEPGMTVSGVTRRA